MALLFKKLYKNVSSKHMNRAAVEEKIPSHQRCCPDFFRSSARSMSLELPFSHLFIVLELEMRKMGDEDLLRNTGGKINNDSNGIRGL